MLKTLLCLSLATTAFCSDFDVSKVSEAVGHMIGKNLNNLGLDFDVEAVAKGIKEESEGKNSPLNEEECVQAINALQEEKVFLTAEKALKQADAASNGDQIYENHSFPAADPSKYR
jgi:hypothetical protein